MGEVVDGPAVHALTRAVTVTEMRSFFGTRNLPDPSFLEWSACIRKLSFV